MSDWEARKGEYRNSTITLAEQSVRRAGMTMEEAILLSDQELLRLPSFGTRCLDYVRDRYGRGERPVKVVQITGVDYRLFALCGDGSIWVWTGGGWSSVPSPPGAGYAK